MNDLIQLIDRRINKQLRESTALSSVPCRISEVYPNGNVKVLDIKNNAEYTVPITACGSGNFTSVNSYILGHSIENHEYYESTNENDYIFRSDENECGIIYYTGESKCPEIPAMLQGKPVTKLYATSFNYSDVTNVYIPEGVEEIE